MTEHYSRALSRLPAPQKKAQPRRRQEKLDTKGVFGLFDMADLAPQAAQAASGFAVRHQPVPPRPLYRWPRA
jgi:hypothetical protein